MKWAKARRHCPDYYSWQDLLHVMLVTLVICFVVALVIVLLLVIMNPRVATAGDIVNWRSARRMAAVVVRSEKVTTRASEPVKTLLKFEITCYSPTAAECSGNPFITASGQRVRVGGIAADLRILPMHSLVRIPGYNNGKVCEVIDTGSMIKGYCLDVFLFSTHEAIHFGRRKNVSVEILRIGR